MKPIKKDQDIAMSCYTIDRIIKDAGNAWSDVIALYLFYLRTARRQGTNQPKCVNIFAAKGLHWGTDRIKSRKAILVKMGLATTIYRRSPDGTLGGWYVCINHIQPPPQDTPTHPNSGQVKITPETDATTGVPATPLDNSTSGVVQPPVVAKTQMLKIQELKCLKYSKDKDEGEGESPNFLTTLTLQPTANSQPTANRNSDESRTPQTDVDSQEIQTAVDLQVIQTKERHTNIQTAVGGQKIHASTGIQISRDNYISEMSKVWTELCGVDAEHILQADLNSNTKRMDWKSQRDYWMKRLEGLDDSQKEAWCLIARYLRQYHLSNGSYPDMRAFLNRWWASSWQIEKSKIDAYCKGHDADPVLKEYIEARATSGRLVKALWLMSCEDYQNWFISQTGGTNDGADDEGEQMPSVSGKPQTMEEWEEYRARMTKDKQYEDNRKKESLELIGRSRALIRVYSDDETMKAKIAQMLRDYKEGKMWLEELRREIENIEQMAAPATLREAQAAIQSQVAQRHRADGVKMDS